MTDLDSTLKLPEEILAEQALQNAGISMDHQLMIRTAIQGDVTMDKVCTELVAQHSRIHEYEARRKGGFKSGQKGWRAKGFGKDRRHWSRAYHVEDEASWSTDDWDTHSQSLGGYEESENYFAEDAYVNDDEEAMFFVYMSLLEEGLDENSEEAVEYAAEIMQVEAEAFFVKNRASHSGHSGFSGGARQFQVHGHFSLEERRARVQALKSRTTCRKCGQTGHWSNDPQCPKGYKKGKGKGSNASSPMSSIREHAM